MDRVTRKMSQSGRQPNKPLEKQEPLHQRMFASFKRVAGKVTDHLRRTPHRTTSAAS